LRENGLEPGPQRGAGTWDEFVRRHAATLWACDFFSTKVWTLAGLVDVFVLFFIQVGSRRVHVAGMTAHPDRAWMTQQARNVAMFFAEQPERPRYLLRDRDTKFVRAFDEILEAEGVTVKAITPCSPNLNAYAERFVQTVRSECLDHFILFGEKHLRHVLSSWLEHYHSERPHQALGNVPPSGAPAGEPVGDDGGLRVVCEERLGGLLKHYRRAA
jgi:putative transposase